MLEHEFEELIKDKDNIIFDFGGIFIDLDINATLLSLSELSNGLKAQELYSKHQQVEVFNEFETGKITCQAFLSSLSELLGSQQSSERIEDAWNRMLHKGIRVERFEYLKKLIKRKRVFLLSNINEIHEKYLEHYLSSTPELKGFYQSFEKVYFSHLTGYRKPNAEAFKIVVDENKLDISKTIFIDDSIQHIEGARKYGLDAIHIDPSNTFLVS